MARTGKDLDPKPEGIRMRVGFTRYNRRKKYFDHMKGATLLVTVADDAEGKRLMQAVTSIIEEGSWRHDHARDEPVSTFTDSAVAPARA